MREDVSPDFHFLDQSSNYIITHYIITHLVIVMSSQQYNVLPLSVGKNLYNNEHVAIKLVSQHN